MDAATAKRTPEWAEKIKVCEFQGVNKFYDILPVLADRLAFNGAINALIGTIEDRLGGKLYRSHYEENDRQAGRGVADLIVSTEARGFLLGPAVAYHNNLGFVPVRKPGKTPGQTSTMAYGKEYGNDTIELQKGLIQPGARVVIIDDLIATGGTLAATAKLVEDQGCDVILIAALVELTELGGAEMLAEAGYPMVSVLKY